MSLLLPTPLQNCPTLAKACGLRQLWVKRDDLIGPGMGGNKARKLAHLLKDARDRNCDTLVTVGAAQSNHARLTAVMGRVAGFECHLVLTGRSQRPSGNLILDRLADAQIEWFDGDEWNELEAAAHALVDRLTEAGRTPYFIPLGGSTTVGARGYLDAYRELAQQMDTQNLLDLTIVHASSTGGTQSGLLAGSVLGNGPDVLGVDVIKGGGPLRSRVRDLTTSLLIEQGSDLNLEEGRIRIVDGTGAAYGAVSSEVVSTLQLAVQAEGLVLDPVYSAKAFLEVIEGSSIQTEDVVFVHTGGQPAVFSERYVRDLDNMLLAYGEPQVLM